MDRDWKDAGRHVAAPPHLTTRLGAPHAAGPAAPHRSVLRGDTLEAVPYRYVRVHGGTVIPD
jgi:hypothetical protein